MSMHLHVQWFQTTKIVTRSRIRGFYEEKKSKKDFFLYLSDRGRGVFNIFFFFNLRRLKAKRKEGESNQSTNILASVWI